MFYSESDNAQEIPEIITQSWQEMGNTKISQHLSQKFNDENDEENAKHVLKKCHVH